MNFLRRAWERFCSLRFAVVGLWNTGFSYAVFAALYRCFGGSYSGDILTQFLTAVLGITNAYVCHRFVTFRSHGVWWREYARFYIVYGGQSLLQAASFVVFSSWFGLNGYIVQVVLTIAFTILSYWCHKIFSFGDSRE